MKKMFRASRPGGPAAAVAAAGLLMALAAFNRMTSGLVLSPLNTASDMGLAALSAALAVGQLSIGLVQPALGWWSDRHGPVGAIGWAAVLLAVATALPALSVQPVAVWSALILAAAACGAIGSNGLLIAAVCRVVPPARAGLAAGVVGAGASAGQLLAPFAAQSIAVAGWRPALCGFALLALLAWPLARLLPRAAAALPGLVTHGAAAASPAAARSADALRDPRFWCMAASFGACGFHVAFLAAHMPGVIERCGLPASLAGTWIALAGAANVAGSLAVGAALKRLDAAPVLSGLYLARVASIALLLCVPASAEALLAFAVAMGASHMATLPPTVQIVARQHGVQRLGFLFGVVMLVHQAGAFAGVWLGGWLAQVSGSDQPLWRIDMGLALLAAGLVWAGALRPGRPRFAAGSRFASRIAAWRSSRRSVCAPPTMASGWPTPPAAAARRSSRSATG